MPQENRHATNHSTATREEHLRPSQRQRHASEVGAEVGFWRKGRHTISELFDFRFGGPERLASVALPFAVWRLQSATSF